MQGGPRDGQQLGIGSGIAAYVSDFQMNYAQWVPEIRLYHCETVPELYPYHPLVNDFTTSAVPVLSVPYGYADGMDPIFAFFVEKLGR